MAEVAAVKAIWDEEVGHVRITNLKVPTGVVDMPKGKNYFGTTGLYCRAYNKELREHQFHLLLYRENDLAKYNDGGTAHLRALKEFTADYGWKVSFCLGFAIANDGMIKRNSCSNVAVTGQRSMPDEWYDQLVDILKRQKLDVHGDMDDLSAMLSQTRIR